MIGDVIVVLLADQAKIEEQWQYVWLYDQLHGYKSAMYDTKENTDMTGHQH